MLKLLQINSVVNWGSTGKIAEQIGFVAKKSGWESYIAYGRKATLSNLNVFKVGNKLSPYIHFIENFVLDREGLGSRCETKHLVEKIKEIKPDIIQLHNIHDHWLNYKILFEYINTTDINVVWTFHDCWAFTGHCFHFVTKGCKRWKIGCYECPLAHEYPNTLIDRSKKNYELKRNLFGECKNLTIVPCSEWMKKIVKESFLKDKRIKVIHNGIDLNVFHPVAEKRKNNYFRIIGVSNIWTKSKGLDDILKLRKSLSIEYEIILVGLNLNQIKNLPEGIVGIERTQNTQELVKLYSEADVLINPTYADTFPTVNLEALACGTPVITYKTGGSPEAIDEKTGVVVEQGDIEAIAKAIREMKEQPLSSEDCRKRAEELFDKDKCFQKYIDLYNEILSENKE